MTYFTYVNGPGIGSDSYGFTPNQFGKPDNDGLSTQNQFSLRYKFSDRFALDFQNRFKLFFNNYSGGDQFSLFRWETPRLGISGRLMGGDDWKITGAFNTDFPCFFPSPLSGYQSQQRTVLVDPGLFAQFQYFPSSSRWSVFAVLTPRYFVYSDRHAVEPQFMKAGFIPENKPELMLTFQPTIQYQITPRIKIASGTTIDYRKQVISNWNPFRASLSGNGPNNAWRLYALPITLGISYAISTYLTLFPYISTFPIAAQRIDAISGKQASITQVTSLGMWVYGTVF